MEIVGSFTNWIPQPLDRDTENSEKYTFDAKLERGYKHR